MALDVTVGGAQANSYLSLAEADALAALSLSSFAAAWTAASDPVQENALRQATRDVDMHVGVFDLWSDTQALRFPRAVDVGTTVPITPFIPAAVKQATYEQAAFLLANQEELDKATIRRARGMFSFNDDDVSGTIAINPLLGRFSPDAERILASVTRTSTGATSDSIPILTTFNVLDAEAAV